MSDMPDPREGDEAAWENVHCGVDPDIVRALSDELLTLEDDYNRVYGGCPPRTAEERAEAGEIQERIKQIVDQLDARPVS